MSSRTRERAKGVAAAWKREKQLVLEGKGTRDWTEEQQKQLIERGKIYDEEERAYEAHHMKNVAQNPEYAADVNNMQILSYEEHHEGAHGGNTHTPTNGYYNPLTGETTDFGDGPPISCEILKLTDPIYLSVAKGSLNNNSSEDKDIKESDSSTNKSVKENVEPDGHDEKIIDEKRNKSTCDSLKVQREKKDNNSKTIHIKSPKVKSPVSSGLLGKIKQVAKAGVKFVVNNPEIVIPVVIDFASRVISKGGKTKGTGNNSNINKSPKSIKKPSVNTQVVDTSPISSIKQKRSSPREHIVPSHGQHYGKNKVWKEKPSYTRGGKKNN